MAICKVSLPLGIARFYLGDGFQLFDALTMSRQSALQITSRDQGVTDPVLGQGQIASPTVTLRLSREQLLHYIAGLGGRIERTTGVTERKPSRRRLFQSRGLALPQVSRKFATGRKPFLQLLCSVEDVTDRPAR